MTRNVTNVKYSQIFDKQLKKAPLKIKKAFLKRREMFLQNPFHSQLNNHKLTGQFSNYRSINISGDWRTIYSEYIIDNEKVVVFEILGTHSQLYK